MIRRCGYLILCTGFLVALLAVGGVGRISAQVEAPPRLAFVNGWWFNGRAFEKRTVFSVNGRFTFKTLPRVDRTVDLADGYVVPPFAEAHNHNLGTGVEDRDKATIQRYLDTGPGILNVRPDFIKTFLLFSDQFEQRRADPAYAGQKGLDPHLLPRIVAKAHANGLRVSTHVANAADFHYAVTAGVDEIAHLPPVGDIPISVADAKLAAKRRIVVDTTYFNAVPSLVRMKVVSEGSSERGEGVRSPKTFALGHAQDGKFQRSLVPYLPRENRVGAEADASSEDEYE